MTPCLSLHFVQSMIPLEQVIALHHDMVPLEQVLAMPLVEETGEVPPDGGVAIDPLEVTPVLCWLVLMTRKLGPGQHAHDL